MTHDIESRDQIIADLSERLIAAEAEVERLKNRIEDYEDDYRSTLAGPCDDEQHCACVPHMGRRINELETEVERLKAHTWEQERAAIVEWLCEKSKTYRRKTWCELVDILAQYIERGEHWPTEGKP